MSKSIEKNLRCFAEKREGQWTAVCLDFSLAAQADTSDEATEKLKTQIESYVHEACDQDSKYFDDLINNRKSPISMWARYYFLRSAYAFNKFFSSPNYKATFYKEETVALCP